MQEKTSVNSGGVGTFYSSIPASIDQSNIDLKWSSF